MEAAREFNIIPMPEWWDNLKENELPEPYREIAGIIGINEAVKLFRMQGRSVYLGKRQKTEQQTENWIEFINIIGIENARKICKQFASNDVYFKKADELLRERRDELIAEDFNGGNYGALATKYGLTERWVRDIIDQKRKIEPYEQIGFDELSP